MLAAHAEIPPGTIPSNMCSDVDLRNCGLDPVHVRQLENELAEMGLGLGISIGGIFRGIGKVAKRGFKIGRGVVRVAAPIATQFIPGPAGAIARRLIGGGGGPPPGPPPWEYGQPAGPLGPGFVTTMRLGWWVNSQTGREVQGTQTSPPDRSPGWQWSATRPTSRRALGRPRVPRKAAIPRSQAARVALYEQQFGPFDSGKNAYWSLMAGRPVTLAQGAQYDADKRAGRPTPSYVVPAGPSPAPAVYPAPAKLPMGAPPGPSLEERIAGIVGRILPAVPQIIEAVVPGVLPPTVPAMRPPPIPSRPPAPVAPPAAPSPVVITTPGAPAAAPAAMPPWLIPALLGVGALVILPNLIGGRKSA